MLERKDRRQDTTTTTGTGTISLGGSADAGYLPFDFTDGATIRYLIQTDDKSEWEVGEGVFTSGTPDTLSRVTIYASSNAGSLVNFSAGTKKVYCVATAKEFDQATGTDIDTGTDDTKFVTPKAIEDSNIYNAPQGFLLNGKIVPSVSSNNLTVAIKTLAGADPSTSDPVKVRIGDTLHSITSDLSVTANAGTNWFNAGSSELATKEIDYFVYLGYNATDGVTIGFARIPYANEYDDFSTISTNEKYCAISTITNAAATDYYSVIGRFAATLSAGDDWTVPTFTAKNLIQRPIFETRPTTAINPVVANLSGTTVGKYQIVGNLVFYNGKIDISAAGGASIITFSAPFKSSSDDFVTWGTAHYLDAGIAHYILVSAIETNSNQVKFMEDNFGNYMIGNRSGINNGDAIDFTIIYAI